MRKLLMAGALVGAVMLPAAAMAYQGACVAVTGSAGVSPGLEAIPVPSGTFTFAATNTGTCGGDQMWGGLGASGTLTAPSCNGNVHQGKVNSGKASGLQFQGVCVGATCVGGGVLGGQGSYQLVFDATTIQAAADKCDPEAVAKDNDKGLTTTSFIGAIEAKVP